MINEEITKLLKEHEERKAIGKPFIDEEYAEADAEDKVKMDDYADTWPSARPWTKKNWIKRATSLTKGTRSSSSKKPLAFG